MSYTKLPFVFGIESVQLTAEDFALRLPKGIQNKTGLFSHFAKGGHFPAYFGNNWDALNDCLRDFSWLSQKRILIVHDDLPLSDNEKELLTYLEILDAAVTFWKRHEQHELLVIFPQATEAIIENRRAQ